MQADRTRPARVQQEWRNRVAAEYRSAATTAQLLHGMLRCGMPTELLTTALRIVQDEIDHAALSREALLAFSGGEEGAGEEGADGEGADGAGADPAVALSPEDLADAEEPEGPLATLAAQVIRNFCLGETLAVPLFAAMRAGTDHPVVRPILDRILRDEAVHRAFGWDCLAALVDAEPSIRPWAAQRLPGWIAAFWRAYGAPRPSAPLTPLEQAAGLLPIPDYNRIYAEAMAEDILPRFARLGIIPALVDPARPA